MKMAGKMKARVEMNVKAMVNGLESRTKVIASCGGGMPPGVSTDNLSYFLEMVRKYS